MKKGHYYVFCAGEWLKCTKAKALESGWLEYELADGTAGLTQPRKWAFGILGSHNIVWPVAYANRAKE